jgi:hypothetical protein
MRMIELRTKWQDLVIDALLTLNWMVGWQTHFVLAVREHQNQKHLEQHYITKSGVSMVVDTKSNLPYIFHLRSKSTC